MQELTTVSNPSPLTTSSQLSTSNLLQPLMSAMGWKDLKPAIVAAEQADQVLALELQQAYEAYSITANEASQHRLQMVLDQVIGELQAELARVKKLEKEAAKRLAKSEAKPSGFLASWGSWLKQSAQTFFGSDDASLVERYNEIAQKRQEEIAQLTRLRQGLMAQTIAQSKKQDAVARASATVEDTSPIARRLLQDPSAPITVSQYCYPTGACDLSSLYDGTSGFVLQGEAASDYSGISVSAAGDINGDGVGDLIIGAYQASPSGRTNAGKSYVVFGSRSSIAWGTGTLELSALANGVRGFTLQGEVAGDSSGTSVSGAGDVNGDGIGDLLIGAPSASPSSRSSAGKSYVVFGSRNSTAWGNGTLELSSLSNGVRGFALQGEMTTDLSGQSVGMAGDVNGDGVGDLIIGAYNADPNNRTDAGKSYVVFGSRSSIAWGTGTLDLSNLINGVRGFVLQGEVAGDYSGHSVSAAGDINGDGVGDLIIGAYQASPSGRTNAGKSYVVFGSRNSTAWGNGTLELSNLSNGVSGFMLQGEAGGDRSGIAVSAAGDVNGDGVGDLLVGAQSADPSGRTDGGKSYIVFGSRNSTAWGTGMLELSTLTNGVRGFALQGEAAGDLSGTSVSAAGDVNGDGVGDVVIGAHAADPNGINNAGKSYIVFGLRDSTAWGNGIVELSTVRAGVLGFVLQGEAAADYSGYAVNSAGDVNGDSVDDLLIGAYRASPTGRNYAGKSYVVFGAAPLNFTANNLRLASGDTIRLNDSMLAIANQGPIKLAIEMLVHGSFTLANGTPVNSFYSQNVTAGQIQFVHDDSLVAPAYRVSYKTNVLYSYSDAQIDFLGAAPVLVNNQLLVDQGLDTVLQSSDLSASDRDSSLSTLQFTVSNVQHGQFNLYNATGQLLAANISQFDQQAIFEQQVRFVHDGSTIAPSYAVAVSDAYSTTNSRTAIITFNHAPELTLNSFVIDQGQATTLLPAGISATDKETFNEDLIIEVNNVTHGYFSYKSNPTFHITAFRQFPLITGDVQFTQDGSNTSASFELRAFDGRIYTPWQAAPLQLNHRPVLQGSMADVNVEQGRPFSFDFDQELFIDPDGDPLNYTVQLAGGAPLPKGMEFIPPNHFQGKLSTLSSLQVEVQARDPRGLTATTDFNLESTTPVQSGINWQALYASVSTIGGVILSVGGYFWLRRRVGSHRQGYDFANALREAANLEYHDFMRFGGEVYKTRIDALAAQLKMPHRDFYDRLTPEQKQSFAVCVSETLHKRHLLSPSDCGDALYGCFFGFSVGWSQKLNLKEFEAQVVAIAQESVTAWQAEEHPLTRWPYHSPTYKDKAKAWCCPRPSRAGLFMRSGATSHLEEGVALDDLKHSVPSSPSVDKSSEDEVTVTVKDRSSAASPKFFAASSAAVVVTEDRLKVFEQQISESLQRSVDEVAESVKAVNKRVEQLESRPLLTGSMSSSS